LLALGIPIAALGAQAGVPSLGIAFNAFVLFLVLGSVILAPKVRSLKVTRRFDSVLSVRVPNTIHLRFENLGSDPMSFRFLDEPPPTTEANVREFSVVLRPGSVAERNYRLTPFQRGSDYFRGSFVRLSCPLGLVVLQKRLPTVEPLRIYPNVLALKEFDLLRQRGRLQQIGIRRSRVRGLGTEFESLRDYNKGDDYRKVDWNASARRGKLIVRQEEAERNQSVLLCVDAGRYMLGEINGVTKLDYALDACLMLAQAATFAGDQVGLMVYADQVQRLILPKRGKAHLGLLIDALHDVAVLPVESDSARAFSYLATRWKRRALVVAFTDGGDEDRAAEIASSLGPLTRRHLVLVARLSDPRLEEATKEPLETVSALYRRAAGLFLEEDRERATGVLAAGGIQNLTCEPQDLAARLISYYYDVKERARI
jgi:uncharacterized protein (DUF58 family)